MVSNTWTLRRNILLPAKEVQNTEIITHRDDLVSMSNTKSLRFFTDQYVSSVFSNSLHQSGQLLLKNLHQLRQKILKFCSKF